MISKFEYDLIWRLVDLDWRSVPMIDFDFDFDSVLIFRLGRFLIQYQSSTSKLHSPPPLTIQKSAIWFELGHLFVSLAVLQSASMEYHRSLQFQRTVHAIRVDVALLRNSKHHYVLPSNDKSHVVHSIVVWLIVHSIVVYLIVVYLNLIVVYLIVEHSTIVVYSIVEYSTIVVCSIVVAQYVRLTQFVELVRDKHSAAYSIGWQLTSKCHESESFAVGSFEFDELNLSWKQGERERVVFRGTRPVHSPTPKRFCPKPDRLRPCFAGALCRRLAKDVAQLATATSDSGDKSRLEGADRVRELPKAIFTTHGNGTKNANKLAVVREHPTSSGKTFQHRGKPHQWQPKCPARRAGRSQQQECWRLWTECCVSRID